MTNKWIKLNDSSSGQYSSNKDIKTFMLRSNLCDYSNECIVVKGALIVEGDNYDTKRKKN